MRRKGLVLIFAGFLVASFSVLSFAQEEKSTQQPASGQENPVVAPEAPAVLTSPESPLAAKPVQTEWLYGEVNSVDIANKSIALTYLDYDTDIEKQATVYTDAKTIFENAKSLEDIKPQDMVSADYIVGADSKDLAISISVEKPENTDDLNMEPQVPAAISPEIKPAGEIPAATSPEIKPAGEAPVAPAQEKPASPNSGTEPAKVQ